MKVLDLHREVCRHQTDWHEKYRDLGQQDRDTCQAFYGVGLLESDEIEVLFETLIISVSK